MGKFMKKGKLAGDVAVMDVSQFKLGVRTRAKTLALRRLQSSAAAGDVAAPILDGPDSCYLELRSRRLEKQLRQQNSRRGRRRCGCKRKERPEAEGGFCGADLGSCSIEVGVLEIEASFGENDLGAEPGERNNRESTPCSSTRATATVPTPGSTTKQTFSSAPSGRRVLDDLINIPTPHDLEEFFAFGEKSLQNLFTEKYNFNFANESPLPGRYEWVKVSP